MPITTPCPDSFHITVQKPEYVDGIVDKASALTSVEKVQYSRDVVNTITRIASTTRLFGLALVGILVAMAMVIINNTIRISVYSRRREINIMKYIGATDWYIRWPFLMEGMLLGLFGAVISSGLVALMYSLLENRLSSPFSLGRKSAGHIQVAAFGSSYIPHNSAFCIGRHPCGHDCKPAVHEETSAGMNPDRSLRHLHAKSSAYAGLFFYQ